MSIGIFFQKLVILSSFHSKDLINYVCMTLYMSDYQKKKNLGYWIYSTNIQNLICKHNLVKHITILLNLTVVHTWCLEMLIFSDNGWVLTYWFLLKHLIIGNIEIMQWKNFFALTYKYSAFSFIYIFRKNKTSALSFFFMMIYFLYFLLLCRN